MYKSPIELLITDICNQVLEQQNEAIHQAVLHYVPNVDRDELVKALEYDRSQYEEGYMDGKADAMAELVRCKDCKHYGYEPYDNGDKCCVRWEEWIFPFENDFCSCGERKDND
jgi:hypothetical protein